MSLCYSAESNLIGKLSQKQLSIIYFVAITTSRRAPAVCKEKRATVSQPWIQATYLTQRHCFPSDLKICSSFPAAVSWILLGEVGESQSAKGNSWAVKSPGASQGGRGPVGFCQGVGGRQGKEALLRRMKGSGSGWVMVHSVLAATSGVVYDTGCSVFLGHAWPVLTPWGNSIWPFPRGKT